jgi:hypothetical protein
MFPSRRNGPSILKSLVTNADVEMDRLKNSNGTVTALFDAIAAGPSVPSL